MKIQNIYNKLAVIKKTKGTKLNTNKIKLSRVDDFISQGTRVQEEFEGILDELAENLGMANFYIDELDKMYNLIQENADEGSELQAEIEDLGLEVSGEFFAIAENSEIYLSVPINSLLNSIKDASQIVDDIKGKLA